MKASKEWGPCGCTCGETIRCGDEFVIVEGTMYLVGHEERRTRSLQAIPRTASRSRSQLEGE